MKWRATLTAFSTASAPLLTKKVRFSWEPGVSAVEPFGERDVGLVRGHREAHVCEPVELLADRLDHAGVPMTGVDDADAAAEVDEAVAVGVGQDGSLGVDDGDRRHGRDAFGDRLRAASHEGAAVGAGDLGLQMDDAGHDGPREDGRVRGSAGRSDRAGPSGARIGLCEAWLACPG